MNLDDAQHLLAEAIAAREAAELALNKFRNGKLEITPERIAARNAVWDAQKAVTAAKQVVTNATWEAMLKETEDILPKLRAEYAAAEAAWLAGDGLKDDGAFSGQQYFSMMDAMEKLDEVQNPLNWLESQIKWAERAKTQYAAWLAAEMDKESLDYTDERETRADLREIHQEWMDYRPPWEGLG